ncbi:MAG: putative glycolipid-binding domain-containing protein [Pseudomonadota bacterium]
MAVVGLRAATALPRKHSAAWSPKLPDAAPVTNVCYQRFDHELAKMEADMRSTMWRRIDVPGMEACSIKKGSAGSVISGMAIYASENAPVRIGYSVTCTSDWECSAATVDRWIGEEKLKISLRRLEDGRWSANDQVIDGVDALLDIDLGFTPATNTNAIKRLNLGVGGSSEFTAVWLDDESWTFKPLKQRYERLSSNAYKYVSVDSGYEAELTVDDFSFVQVYPELWETVKT